MKMKRVAFLQGEALRQLDPTPTAESPTDRKENFYRTQKFITSNNGPIFSDTFEYYVDNVTVTQ
jgi:hypothetical protein